MLQKTHLHTSEQGESRTELNYRLNVRIQHTFKAVMSRSIRVRAGVSLLS